MGSSSALDVSLPAGAWDSHVHVADEVSRHTHLHGVSLANSSQEKFPYHEFHPYRPQKADLDDLLAFQRSQGIAHSCLVAFSVYHTDNSSLLDALRRLEGKGRAVACIDPQTVTDAGLQELHDAGTRGIRLNFRTSSNRVDEATFHTLLTQAADRIRPFGWALQLYVSLDQIAQFASVVPRLGVPVVIDHVGHPEPSNGPPRLQEGYREFMDLLRSGQVYTKLSGTYRFDDLPELDSYVQEILTIAPDRVVWASDWPHSGGVSRNPGGDRNQVQEYRMIDDQGWIVQCKRWCRLVGGDNGDGLARKIWVDNPRRLWQYENDQ
jgi:predicted TIM-barrel fold metal-dependent hydrolase